jgi:hypothetical protein
VDGGDENRSKVNSGKAFDTLEWLANLCAILFTLMFGLMKDTMGPFTQSFLSSHSWFSRPIF